MAGTLFVVATPIGNLEDITMRALRILREVQLIAAEDTRRTSHLLVRYGIATPTTSLHEHNERAKRSALVDRLERGDNLALVSDAGTPAISDPGADLVAEAVRRGIRVEPVPGPNAAIAALSGSGIATDVFTFLGFPPTRSKDRKQWFERLAGSGPVIVFYEAPHRFLKTLAELQGVVGDVPLVVARELTKIHEELVRGPISEVMLRLSTPKGEFVVVVDIGHSTETVLPVASASPKEIAHEFGEITETGGLTRRQAIAALSRRHRMGAREIYAAIESAKKSAV